MSKLDPASQRISQAERIGVIGSPSTTSELALDIMASAVNRKLVGELAIFRFMQDGLLHYAMGQITEVAMRNVWHEDPTMRSLIRQHGHVDAVSERQDTHQGKMVVSAVFAYDGSGYISSSLGTVPATGTTIYLADDAILADILEPYREQLFYLGHVYGSKPRLPMWFKHFGSAVDGVGEAYHIGVFGKTGSGKSVLTKMILTGYAKHREMNIFVIDPQGEFSRGFTDDEQSQEIRTMDGVFSTALLKVLGRTFKVFKLDNLLLDRWELFTQLLKEANFFFHIGIKSSEYQNAAAEYVEEFLKSSKYRLDQVGDIQVLLDVFDHVKKNVDKIYSGSSGRITVTNAIDDAVKNLKQQNSVPASAVWFSISQFFAGSSKVKVEQVVQQAFGSERSIGRPIVIVDLSKSPENVKKSVWEDNIKPLIIDRFMDAIIRKAERAYDERKNLNTLIVIDEAHRFVPDKSQNERITNLKSQIVDAVRTTRKYGLGWMFVSQTLSSLDAEVIQQLRIMFFGFGLSMGTEYDKLRQLVSGQRESLNLYQRFRDPQSAFDAKSREYSFMTIGPVSPLSFAGTPLFINAYNDVQAFLTANKLLLQQRMF